MTGSLATKNGKYYVVLNLYVNGKRKKKMDRHESAGKRQPTKSRAAPAGKDHGVRKEGRTDLQRYLLQRLHPLLAGYDFPQSGCHYDAGLSDFGKHSHSALLR